MVIKGLNKMKHKKVIITAIITALAVAGITFTNRDPSENNVAEGINKDGYYYIDLDGNLLNSEPFDREADHPPTPFNEDGIAYVYKYIDGDFKSYFIDKNGNVIGDKYFCCREDYNDYNNSDNNELKVNIKNEVSFPILARDGEEIVILDKSLNQIGQLKDDYGAEKIIFVSTDFKNGLASISIEKDGECSDGYINTAGDWVIEPQYDVAYEFTDEGIALVKESDLFYFIKEDGSYAFEEGFYDATFFADGYAMVQKDENGKAAFINKEGEYITDFIYEFDYDYCGFPEGLAPVKLDEDGEYGYINTQGEMIIDPISTIADNFSCGLAWIGANEYIDKTGNVALDGDFWGVGSFSEDGYAVAESRGDDNRYGIINTKGEWVVEPQFGTEDSGGLLINEPIYANGYCLAYLEKGQIIKKSTSK